MSLPVSIPVLPRGIPIRRTFAMNVNQVELALESLLNEASQDSGERERQLLHDFDFAAKLCFLRGHVVTPSLSELWTYYVRYLGRTLVERVSLENYTLMVNNIFMRLLTSSPPATFQTLDALISEAFMETISQLDDHVTFLTTFPSAAITSTSELSASQEETTTEQNPLPETMSSQQ